MISTEIGEHSRIKLDTLNSILIKCMRRYFDTDAVGTFLQKIRQLGLQSNRIRCGQALWLKCPDETGPNGADESCSMTKTGKRLRQ